MTTTALAPDVFPWLDHSRYTFSLGVSAEGVAVLSGHSASEYDPASGRIVVRGGMSQQTHTAYDKIEAILRSGGLSLQDAVHIVENVSLAGMASYAEAAVVRESRLLGASPTVTTVCADRLLRDTALIEVQVTAVAGGGKPILVEPSAGRSVDGIIYLPSVLAVDQSGQVVAPNDAASQIEAAFDQAQSLLEGCGLDLSNVVHVTEHTTPALDEVSGHTAAIRARRLRDASFASTSIVMSRLAHPDAQIQLDLIASPNPATRVDAGWSRYDGLAEAPAVRAGKFLFVSGQTALDPQSGRPLHGGDVAAQARHAYERVLEVVRLAGGGPEHLVQTIEYVTPDALARYRDTQAVRRDLLVAPQPASTGLICRRLRHSDREIEVSALAVLPDIDASPATEGQPR